MANFKEVEKKYKGESRELLLCAITCMEAERELLHEKIEHLTTKLNQVSEALKPKWLHKGG